MNNFFIGINKGIFPLIGLIFTGVSVRYIIYNFDFLFKEKKEWQE